MDSSLSFIISGSPSTTQRLKDNWRCEPHNELTKELPLGGLLNSLTHIIVHRPFSSRNKETKELIWAVYNMCERTGNWVAPQLPFHSFLFFCMARTALRATQKCQSLIGPGHKQKIGKERKEVEVTAAQRLRSQDCATVSSFCISISVRCRTICELTLSSTYKFILINSWMGKKVKEIGRCVPIQVLIHELISDSNFLSSFPSSCLYSFLCSYSPTTSHKIWIEKELKVVGDEQREKNKRL
jgi:hypothetical protein